jgi:flagellar biosynthetic protein FlhB
MVLIFLVVTAGFDWFWQRSASRQAHEDEPRRRSRTSFKQSEGDPHIKARQKQIRNERSRRG